jgi:hypothetical protein
VTQRRHARISQAEIARVLRAVAQVGLPAAILIEPDGTIKIAPAGEADKREVAKVKEITL